MATIMDACAALQKGKKVTKNGHKVILNKDGELCWVSGVPIVPSIGTMINYQIDEQIQLEPNQWCTGQEWVDVGGSWNDFKEAHKAGKTAEYLSFSSSWGKMIEPLRYDNNKCKYRLKLNDKAELPKPEPEKPWVDCEIEWRDGYYVFNHPGEGWISLDCVTRYKLMGCVYPDGLVMDMIMRYIDDDGNFCWSFWKEGLKVYRPKFVRLER